MSLKGLGSKNGGKPPIVNWLWLWELVSPQNNIRTPMLSGAYTRGTHRRCPPSGMYPCVGSERPKWILIVQSSTDTRRNPLKLLKGKQVYSTDIGCSQRRYTTGRQSSKAALPKRKQPSPYWTSVHRGIPWVEKTKAETHRRRQQTSQEAWTT